MELYEIKQGRARGYLSLTVLQELSPRHGTKRIGNIVETRQATCFRNNLYFSQKFPAMRQSYLIYYIEKVISSSFSIILRSSISTFAICTGAKKNIKRDSQPNKLNTSLLFYLNLSGIEHLRCSAENGYTLRVQSDRLLRFFLISLSAVSNSSSFDSFSFSSEQVITSTSVKVA